MSSRNHSPLRSACRLLGAATLAGTAVLGYSLIEARSYRLRFVSLEALPPGQAPLRVLHVSDLHLAPYQHHKRDWIRSLAALEPDLVVGTGDFQGGFGAVGPVISALGPLLDMPGAFVMGSNDYYPPKLANPLRYLQGPSEQKQRGEPVLPWKDLVSIFVECGWADLDNRRALIKVGDRVIDARGVDDPHIEWDDYSTVAGPYDPDADLKLAVLHAPYLRVLDAMAADGPDLILAGHTHGGQVCIPYYGALVTNCDLDTRRVKGLSTHEGVPLHVSAGIGTNPYTPVRTACAPEATLITLTAREL